MPANEIHLDDVGTKFLLTVKDGTAVVDISSASTKQIIIKKPSGTVLTKGATFETDGTNGQINYTIIATDLDEVGTYQLQGKVIITDGTFRTDITKFKVHRNL